MDLELIARLALASAVTACLCLYCLLKGIEAWVRRQEEKRRAHDALMARLMTKRDVLLRHRQGDEAA